MAARGQKDECDFYKALCTIRGKDGKTKGIACAVDIDGKKNKNEVVLVTWKGCNGEGKNSVKTVHRYSRKKKNPKDYQLEPTDGSILNRGNFSLIRCACGNDKWGVRLSPKYLKEEEQKADFQLVYTVDTDCYRSLTLKYHESTNEHRFDIKEEEEHIYANLILRGAPMIQGEKYFVGVLTEDEEGKVSPLFITEGVFDQPEFTKHPESQTVRERSKSVTFSCDTDSNPAVTFLWTKDGIPLNVTTNPRYSLSDDKKQLRIKDVNKTDRGEYKCVVQKGANTVNSTDAAVLTVEYQPEFTTHPEDRTRNEGQSVIFSCHAVGYPVPTFLWIKDGFAVNTDDHRISLSENNTHLTITNVNGKDRGEYRCEAHNIVNTVKSNAAMLTVQHQPEFTTHPEDRTRNEGQSVIFSCHAVGYPVPTFLWIKDGFAVNTDDHRISLSENDTHLTITNVNGKDRGEYRCEAHNIVNTVKSNAAMLTVQLFLGLNIDVKEITCGTESCPTTKEVLKAIVHKYAHSKEPFVLEGFRTFVDHLERMHRLLVVDAHVDCLIVTVRCSSLQILDELWEDYRTGHLNEMAQKYLVTEEILKEFGLIELKLMTTIEEEEYRACRQYFLQWPDPGIQDVASLMPSSEGEDTQDKDVKGEIPAGAAAPNPGIQDVASLTPSSEGEDTQDKDVKGELPASKAAPDSREPLSVLLVGLSEKQQTGLDYTSEQLNYLKLCYLAFVVVAQGLRMIFKKLWDDQYRKLFGEWMDTPRNGKDFYNLESPRNHRKFPRQLATMINGTTEEWDCAMFFYAILYSDCLSHFVIGQVRSAVDDLRVLRSEIAHWPQAYVSYPAFSSICIRTEAAFKSLNLPTIPLQIIREKVHFSSGSTKELVSLQFFKECTPEQVDYLRLCYLVFDVVPRGLRVIFKREWDIRFKETLGEWLDTPENGREFCESARPDSQRRYLLATMVNGNREEWDSTMLYYAIVQSKSIGSSLDSSVRSPVNELREVRNETVKNAQGHLSATEFELIVQKVQSAFKILGLSTLPIDAIMQQRMKQQRVMQQSGLPYVVGEVGKKQLQSVEHEHEKDVSSFCRLPFKPPIEIIGRNSDKEKILQELKTLKKNNGNSLSCLIISGRPGSGKSQLARQVADCFYYNATKITDAHVFVMTLNAESSDSLLESFISFAQQIKCSEIEVNKILVSEEKTSDEKIIRLKNLIQERIHLYTTWLLVIDNVTGVRSILKSVPEVNNPQWKMGQMLIATRDAIGPELAVDSFTCHISISQGMEPGDAISLLAAVSGADDKEMLAKVAKELDYQPLALVNAAMCVKHDCQSNKEPNRAWTEILNELIADKEMESVSGDISTPESSVLKSTDAVVRLAVESLIRTNEVIKYVFTCLSLFKPQEFDLDKLITYVQIVEDLQHKKEITKTSESQIKECPLLLLGEEANNVRIGVHQVVLNGVKSALLEKRSPASSEVLAAVNLIHQMEIDPFEERRDELVFDDRIIPLLPS